MTIWEHRANSVQTAYRSEVRLSIPGNRKAEKPCGSGSRMVGVTGIEPVTPTMST